VQDNFSADRHGLRGLKLDLAVLQAEGQGKTIAVQDVSF